MDDMGSFRIDIEVESMIVPGDRRVIRSVLVDTGAAILYASGASTADEVIFGEPGDLVLLGSRSLEGLNLRIDPVAKRLSDAGPMPLAVVG